MLIEMVAATSEDTAVEVWLPTDLVHPQTPLCEELIGRGVTVQHLPLPIMRRAYRRPIPLAKLAFRAWRLRSLLRKKAPSTVYCTTSAAFLAAPAARAARVPKVYGHVQEIWSASDRLALGLTGRACHRLLAISTAVVESLPPALQQRTTVVANGTPEPAESSSLVGRTGPLQFVIASRWNGWKGHRTLLAAWDRLDAPGELVVLGGPPASGEFVDIADLVAKLRHPASVRIVGEVPDPSSYLSAADVVLMPSDQPEPFGLVAIEAFARGRPVIASAAGGLLDIVESGVNGWLFSPGDPNSLATVLQTLTRESVTVAGEQARASYEQRFTTERFAADWRRALQP
jgi:glycosyltransferase involved in cell wall biosynthesis